jgi:hypothetical protein
VQAGDRIIIEAGYSFDGEIGIVKRVENGGEYIEFEVPSYYYYPDNGGNYWNALRGGYKRIPTKSIWSDRLEAEMDLDKLIAKYSAQEGVII